jgi:hypothetical protein
LIHKRFTELYISPKISKTMGRFSINASSIILATLLISSLCRADESALISNSKKSKRSSGGGGSGLAQQRAAMEKWAGFLSEKDYNASAWPFIFKSRSVSSYFHHYAEQISNVFKENKANVNFVMIGKYKGGD